MQLNRKQEEGLKIAVARFRSHEPYTVISGFAGTGKSTLIKFIVSALRLDPASEVAYVAYTGKAANVLAHKGCANATTAHKLLYYSNKGPDGKFHFRPRPRLDGNFKLIVVDEVSMLPKQLWDQLLKHHVHIIACGDPFQLPPVDRNSDNGLLREPHIFLDEIMRQAAESDIIRLSMDIRNGKIIKPMQGIDANVVSSKDVVDGMFFWADEVIAATNKKRKEINNYIRKEDGKGPEPVPGDKIILLNNKWDIVSSDGNALVNGTIGYLTNFSIDTNFLFSPTHIHGSLITCNIDINDTEYFENLPIDYSSLMTGKFAYNSQQSYMLSKKAFLPIEANYGYCITCHRAQGSEWNKVLVIEENFPFDKEEHARWLYTAVTRASEKLTLVLDD